MTLLRQFELQSGDELLMTWLPVEDTRQVGIGSVISLKDDPKRWTIIWKGASTLEQSQVQKKRFTNSAVRDQDGRWVV